jgi:hypothetical protein
MNGSWQQNFNFFTPSACNQAMAAACRFTAAQHRYHLLSKARAFR